MCGFSNASGGAETCGKPQDARTGTESQVGILLVVQGRGNGGSDFRAGDEGMGGFEK